MEIILKDYKCECGRSVKKWKLKYETFKKDYFNVTERTASVIWKKKCCWLCKSKPVAGEKWSMSFGGKLEKNRLFCPECSEVIAVLVKPEEVCNEKN